MLDPTVLASINLHAVLRNLEDLTELDQEAREALSGHNCAIRFSVPGVDRLTLAFSDGRCQATRGEDAPCTMNLRFSSPTHLNLMIDGKKNPLPTKGFRSIGFLKNNFTKAADILTSYLRPDPERLKSDPAFFETATILLANTALFAASEVANLDPAGKALLAKIETGAINVTAADSYAVSLTKTDRLTTTKGARSDARAFMEFDSLEAAGGVLRGELDGFVLIGKGQMGFRGRVPMIDNLNKLLLRVSAYIG